MRWAVINEEMDMYVGLHPLTNRTPHMVVETMSVAKAMVLFREVGLRHMLVLPKHNGPTVSIQYHNYKKHQTLLLFFNCNTWNDKQNYIDYPSNAQSLRLKST